MSSRQQETALDDAAERVREARALAGLTRRQLARRAGVSRRAVAAIERGDQVPVTDLHAIAETLDAGSAAPADPAREQLLREYLGMVVEMRATTPDRLRTLRTDDLELLAAHLGDTPEHIESQLIQLLDTLRDDAIDQLADPRCA